MGVFCISLLVKPQRGVFVLMELQLNLKTMPLRQRALLIIPKLAINLEQTSMVAHAI